MVATATKETVMPLGPFPLPDCDTPPRPAREPAHREASAGPGDLIGPLVKRLGEIGQARSPIEQRQQHAQLSGGKAASLEQFQYAIERGCATAGVGPSRGPALMTSDGSGCDMPDLGRLMSWRIMRQSSMPVGARAMGVSVHPALAPYPPTPRRLTLGVTGRNVRPALRSRSRSAPSLSRCSGAGRGRSRRRSALPRVPRPR
jgi:hypothetical protein